MLRLIALAGAALSVGALPAIAQDLVVESGVVTIGPGEVYDSLTVRGTGEVIIDGGEILGDVRMGLGGRVTLNDGTIHGFVETDPAVFCDFGVDCGSLIVNGGVISQTIRDLDVEINGGRVAAIIETRAGTTRMTGGVAESISVGAFIPIPTQLFITGGEILGNVGGGDDDVVLISNAIIRGNATGTLNEGAIVEGNFSHGSIREGAWVGGNASSASVTGGRLEGSLFNGPLTNGFVTGGSVGGNAFNTRVTGGRVEGVLSSPGFFDYNESRARAEDCVLGGVACPEFGFPISVKRSKITGPVTIGMAGEVIVEAYALEIDGETRDLSGSDVVITNWETSALELSEVTVVAADGRQSTFPVTIDAYEDNCCDPGGSIRFRPVALEVGCAPADLAIPFGVLDLADLFSFVTLFGLGDEAAEFGGDPSVRDLADVTGFVASFTGGCP